MNTNKLLTMTTAVAIFVGGLTSAPAQNSNDFAAGTRPGHGRILRRFAKELNLTGDQKTQIRAVLKADKDVLAGLAGQLREARQNLRTAIHASDANETAVRAASANVASAEADLAVERMKLYGKIAPILTDEQRRQISDLEQRPGRRDGALARRGEPSAD
jgi:Spy/CpxP family protein refolding chaperone